MTNTSITNIKVLGSFPVTNVISSKLVLLHHIHEPGLTVVNWCHF